MKTRQGFVSNSSSSSFLLIGTDNRSVISQIEEAERKLGTKFDEGGGCGEVEGKYFHFASPGNSDEELGYTKFYAAGLPDAEQALEEFPEIYANIDAKE